VAHLSGVEVGFKDQPPPDALILETQGMKAAPIRRGFLKRGQSSRKLRLSGSHWCRPGCRYGSIQKEQLNWEVN
jgi:hypothetical protein